jgi:hypothetical protein
MEEKSVKDNLPFGISLLRVFYAINAFLLLFTSLLFFDYLDVIFFGKAVSAMQAAGIRLLLVILPLYLVFGFSYLKKTAYHLAVIYQSLFIINAVAIIAAHVNKSFPLRPLFEITIKPEFKTRQIGDLLGSSFQLYAVQIFSILIGASIIVYLFKKRKIFTG